MKQAECAKCSGTGWVTVERESPRGKVRRAVPCDCLAAERKNAPLERARIPRRYLDCDFANFETDLPHDGPEAATWNRSLQQARLVVQGFAREYPAGREHGLLLLGPCGVGKTHLAVAALRELVGRGHEGVFYDYRELLKEIQASYNPVSQTSEMEVLEPVLKVEVLLLDDLGASKPSAWVLDTVGHILNARYNENRVTLLTTNFLDREDAAGASRDPRSSERIVIEDSLADRVGHRIRSRLYEMCRTVEICACDYRKEIRQAGRYRA
jgi:DNA replication protein DnaC